jgi:hypothetical protein
MVLALMLIPKGNSASLRGQELESVELSYFQTDGRYDYRTELLELALSYTKGEEPLIHLIPRPDIPVVRAVKLIEQPDFLGIVSLATSREHEQDLLAIKIPILAGILGLRVFLIHKDNAAIFSNIDELAELKNKALGFGEHWLDLAILKDNGFSIVGVSKYQSLFDMLNAKRFDYFPRGVNEILGEYKQQKAKLTGLAIEKKLSIYYPYPVYFFLSKHDEKIAERIRYGLQQALLDGRFKQLFLRYHQDLLQQLNFDQRLIFTLRNDALPEDAIIKNAHWWLENPSRLQ